MDNLTPQMKERLEEWKKNKPPVKNPQTMVFRRQSSTKGDVATLEEWDAEVKLSQRRK